VEQFYYICTLLVRIKLFNVRYMYVFSDDYGFFVIYVRYMYVYCTDCVAFVTVELFLPPLT